MAAGARDGRRGALLQLAVALTISLAVVQGQQIAVTGCGNYQSSTKFNSDYIAKLTSVEEGYAMLLTSDRPRTSGCQQINFYSNGTFYLSYKNDYNVMTNHTGDFIVQLASFTQPGYIDISVPPEALGSGLMGDIRLFFIVAEEDYFVVTTCEQFGIFALELVHAFVPTSQLGTNASVDLNSTLSDLKVPQIKQLREVNQACAANLRGTPSVLDIYNFLVKLGVFPALSFRSDSLRERRPNFYASNPSSVAYTGYPYFTAAGGPVQSFAYGPSQGNGHPIRAFGQAQTSYYNAPPASSGHPFTYQTQGNNYVPVVPNQYQSPASNYRTAPVGFLKPVGVLSPGGGFEASAFGAQQPGVQFISRAPANSQSPGGSYDPASFSSQVSGMTVNPAAFSAQVSGMNVNPTPFSAQVSGMNANPAPFSAQLSGMNVNPAPFSAQLSGMNVNPSPFSAQFPVGGIDSAVQTDQSSHIQSSVISQDQSMFGPQSPGYSNEPSPYNRKN